MAESAPSAEDDTNGEAVGYPAGVLAAAVLATTGVSFVLVGSAALWLRGESIRVGDADVVIEPDEQNIQRARAALAVWRFSLTLSPRPPVLRAWISSRS